MEDLNVNQMIEFGPGFCITNQAILTNQSDAGVLMYGNFVLWRNSSLIYIFCYFMKKILSVLIFI